MEAGPPIEWRLHLQSPPEEVFRAVTSTEGQMTFWAEYAKRSGNEIDFVFPDGAREQCAVLETSIPRRFVMKYFGSTTSFELADDGAGGTDLSLRATDVPMHERSEVAAGWVSVLLALKASVDYGVDVRNHDPARTWAQGYVDN